METKKIILNKRLRRACLLAAYYLLKLFASKIFWFCFYGINFFIIPFTAWNIRSNEIFDNLFLLKTALIYPLVYYFIYRFYLKKEISEISELLADFKTDIDQNKFNNEPNQLV